ncbi:Las17-binding protein actin regulator [Nitzschia inconspicua]|uniref:Las17-binding protein actin regulator n=1 Tax=Nitzschia inconspicua TaxID=303405 RepID=A0A9K3PFF7_9STRA|nr:Las17-binding protein actin regulator [Nitzschia inconspicua]
MMGTIVRDMPPEEERGDTAVTVTVTPSKEEKSPTQTSSPSAAASSPTTSNVASYPDVPDIVDHSVATLSNPWEFDVDQPYCTRCRDEFHPFNRRHHCRLCGKIFCNKCSDQRALIPPSAIVLTPKGGKKATPDKHQDVTFTPDPDPDRMLTYIDQDQQLLYGKGLEERFQLAREPLRVCPPCHEQLQPLQHELRNANSNAMRFNHIDPTDPKRFLNSPVAFTLGHEVRKAAYALNNLLPMPKRMGSVVDINSDGFLTGDVRDIQACKEECAGLSPNLSNMDGVRIPARLLEQAKGIAILTVVKGGFGLAGVEFGTGLVIARLGEHHWSAPCAIGTAGVSWGALIGAQVSDHVFLLMTDAAVELMFNNNGNLQLGADVGVAVGPLGRALEADFGAAPGTVAPIYTYSLSKGLYAGISLDGKIIVTRHRVNERFYGREVTGLQLLSGEIPSPPAARPLYDALQRCHVYATGNRPSGASSTASHGLFNRPKTHVMHGYPEIPPPQPMNFPSMIQEGQFEAGAMPDHPLGNYDSLMPPAFNDQHSYAGMSDVTSDPGY